MHGFQTRLTAYYPDGYKTDAEARREGGPLDVHNKALCTLQAYLSGHAPYVSVACDLKAFPYGTAICLPHLDDHYGRVILFKACDTGDDFKDQGRSRLDICVTNKTASFDPLVNSAVSAVALLP